MKFEIRFVPVKGEPQQIAIVEAPDLAAAQRAAKWLINDLAATDKMQNNERWLAGVQNPRRWAVNPLKGKVDFRGN